MNADIIVIEGRGHVADGVSVAMAKEALSRRGINNPNLQNADADTLSEAFNAALARSNIIMIIGGLGDDSADNAMKTVADDLNEECEMNFSALGRIASSYARAGKEMPDTAAKAATVIHGSAAIPNTVGIAVGCALSLGSQHIVLLPGAADEVGAMLDGAAGDFLDTAVKSLSDSYESSELEFTAEEHAPTAEDAVSEITFNPGAITVDEPVIEPKADNLDETVVFNTEPEISEEFVPEPEMQTEPESYVVLTPTHKENKEPETQNDEEYVDLTEAANAPEEKEKISLGMKIARFFIPWKGDRAVDILRKVVFAVAIVGLVISSCYISDFFIKMADNRHVLDEARDLYDKSNNQYNEETNIYNRFEQLIAQNSDCVGWISVPNTRIDNPVYKTTDNDFYLTHNNKKNASVYGAIFADYRDGITVHGNSQNVTLYGHHMKDGTMFADLHKYKKMSFYKENPVITFDTLYGTGGQYKVFACFITNSNPMDDNGYFFDFAVPNYDSELDFMNWVEQVRRRSLYSTPVDVVATDEILTLSTCTYEVKDHNLLCVVVARKVRDGETAAVNTINTSTNSRIIYPAIWYEKLGGQKPTYADGLYTWVYGDYNREDINAPTNTSSLPSDNASSGAASSEITSSAATSTEAPSEPASSAAPPASSVAPPVSSAAPPVSSAAPPVSSEEPPVSSAAPPASSEEPPVSSSAPPEST